MNRKQLISAVTIPNLTKCLLHMSYFLFVYSCFIIKAIRTFYIVF